MRKIKIGDEKVIRLVKRRESYISLRESNGVSNQEFRTIDLEPQYTLVCIGREKIKGVWYEKYTTKEIPFKELKFKGLAGIKNFSREVNSIAKLFKGQTKDGEKLEFVRTFNEKDLNSLTGVTVDFDKKIVYQKPNKNINQMETFGEIREVREYEKIYAEIFPELTLIKNGEKYWKFGAYYYDIRDLELSEEIKDIIFGKYYLDTCAISSYKDKIQFCISLVDNNYIYLSFITFGTDNYQNECDAAGVRPVGFIKSPNQQDE